VIVISIIGQYRYSSALNTSTKADGIVNIASFKISGLGNTAGLAVCLYKWDATNSMWVPYTG